ncbi:MAG: Mitochondrial inner membrane protein oxa1, partial [Pleopsidium flavum]
MASHSPERRHNLSDSSMTIPSDSENYSANNELSPSPPSSSSSPLILYSPPTIWGLLRGAAINLLLPFVNGLMLGFGELLAHEAAFRLGWSGTKFTSSTSRSYQQPLSKAHPNPLLAHKSSWQIHSIRIRSPVFAASALRFASSTSEASQSSGVVTVPTDTFATSSLDEISKITTSDLAAVPEHIGYLKNLGLDYGWGPTAFIETLLEHIHFYTGTPWWASILLTAVTVRIALLKPYIGAADVSARTAAIQPITSPIREKMMAAQRGGDQQGMLMARQELMLIHKRAGIQMYKAFVPLVQIFLGFGTFRLFRGMATLPVPGLETGGFLWLKDLTVPDPYLILPIVTAGAFYQVMKKGGETGTMMLSPMMQKLVIYVLPAMSGTFMLFWPGAMQLTFFATSMMSMIQATLFRNPSFRAWVGIYPLPPHPAKPGVGGSAKPKDPYEGAMTMYQPPNATASATEEKKG